MSDKKIRVLFTRPKTASETTSANGSVAFNDGQKKPSERVMFTRPKTVPDLSSLSPELQTEVRKILKQQKADGVHVPGLEEILAEGDSKKFRDSVDEMLGYTSTGRAILADRKTQESKKK